MIDQRFMQSLADDMKDPMLGETEAPAQDVLLAAGPVASDMDKPFIGTRLNVPRAGQPQPTAEDRQRLGIQLFDALAGMPKGAIQGTVGLPGDLEGIGRAVLGVLGYDVSEETVLPTAEDIGKRLESILGPVVPKGQTTIVPTAEREKAARIGETIGEFTSPVAYVSPGIRGAIASGARMVGRAVQATKNMPVGMSTQMVGEGVSDLGFYSAAKQAVDSIQQPKGTGEQFLKQIEKTPGVKPEEIKWTGLDDFLKSKKTVTKAEVQEYLDKNRVEVKEVQLGGGYATIEKELNKQGYELNVDMDGDWSIFKNNEYVELNELPADLQKFVMENSPGKTETKFSKYTLPGGENYREILLTLPSKNKFDPEKVDIVRNRQSVSQGTYTIKYDNKEIGTFSDEFNVADNYKGYSDEQIMNHAKSLYEKGSPYSGIKPISTDFKSQHFDQPNILAHMRVNDRVDADGKKVLFVEEVQSDWHQAGRKKGYFSQEAIDKNMAEQSKLVAEKTKILDEAKPFTDKGMDAPQDVLDRFTAADDRLTALRKEESKLKMGTPDAPFKTTWHELALKRAIQVAAEGGYDRIAFTTGKTQAERYDLSKEIDSIRWSHSPDGTYGINALRDTDSVISKNKLSIEQVEELVGKDIAKKIEIGAKDSFAGAIQGVDLQVGGEGMKGFYDQILPKFLDKYAKKWDAKVGTTQIRLASDKQDMADSELLGELGLPKGGKAMADVQYIDITPKMKESVLTKGQPLFAIGAGGAAVQQEENE